MRFFRISTFSCGSYLDVYRGSNLRDAAVFDDDRLHRIVIAFRRPPSNVVILLLESYSGNVSPTLRFSHVPNAFTIELCLISIFS